MIVNIITKNPCKLMAAKAVFSEFNIKVRQIKREFPEIQADTSLEIAKHTALQAVKALNIPVIREDHSLFVNALGIPGPYTSFIKKRLTVEKLLEILKSQKDRSGYFEIASVYAEPSGLIKEYSYQVPVLFQKEIKIPDPQGGWDGIIRLANETKAFTEYPAEERAYAWGENLKRIAEFLTSRI